MAADLLIKPVLNEFCVDDHGYKRFLLACKEGSSEPRVTVNLARNSELTPVIAAVKASAASIAESESLIDPKICRLNSVRDCWKAKTSNKETGGSAVESVAGGTVVRGFDIDIEQQQPQLQQQVAQGHRRRQCRGRGYEICYCSRQFTCANVQNNKQIADAANDDQGQEKGSRLMTTCRCNSMPHERTLAISRHSGSDSRPQLSRNKGHQNIARACHSSSLLVLSPLLLLLLLSATQLGQLLLSNQHRRGAGILVRAADVNLSSRFAKVLYPDSAYGCDGRRTSDTERIVCLLKYEIKPLMEIYRAAYGEVELESRLNSLFEVADSIDEFVEVAFSALDQHDFCSYSSISRLQEFKEKHIGGLMNVVYDLVTIDYHKSCLLSTIEKLPKVPSNIRYTVQTYIDGVDKSLPDLNSGPLDHRERMLRLDLDDSMEVFDVKKAIDKNGPLDLVMSLSLTMPFGMERDGQTLAREFVKECHNFVLDINNRWQTMDMLNNMLDNYNNSIARLNNYIVRLLKPTKYADICSQISFVYESKTEPERRDRSLMLSLGR